MVRKIIVGLGNPGPRYSGTPHNLGFRVLDSLAQESSSKWHSGDPLAMTAEGRIGDSEVLLTKPETYVNRSGEAVRYLLIRYGVLPADLIVVCDDVALPFGRLRIRRQGGDGGHNGLKSIIAALSSEAFPRVRLGIAPDSAVSDLADYVLTPIPENRSAEAEQLVLKAKESIRVIVSEGLTTAMNRFNTAPGGNSQEEQLARE